MHQLLGSLKPLQEERKLLYNRLDVLNPHGGKQIKYGPWSYRRSHDPGQAQSALACLGVCTCCTDGGLSTRTCKSMITRQEEPKPNPPCMEAWGGARLFRIMPHKLAVLASS